MKPAVIHPLLQRAPAGAPLWLDGPTGTQLEAAGFVAHPLLWTAAASESAPALLSAVHRRYLSAGAHCLTANTFRTTAFAAQQAGIAVSQARRWAQQAVALARQVGAEFSSPRFVLGSLAPLADCYAPSQTPDDAIIVREHARTIDWLLEAGCDGLLLETQGSGRELRLALGEARRVWSGPVLVSLLPDASGERLLGGDDLWETARAGVDLGADALLVNCAHHDVLLRALRRLSPLAAQVHSPLLLGAYPNAARRLPQGPGWGWQVDDEAHSRIAERTQGLWQAGARILGACCGFGPADLAQMIAALRS